MYYVVIEDVYFENKERTKIERRDSEVVAVCDSMKNVHEVIAKHISRIYSIVGYDNVKDESLCSISYTTINNLVEKVLYRVDYYKELNSLE